MGTSNLIVKIRAMLIMFHALCSVLRAVLNTWLVFSNHLLKNLLSEFNLNNYFYNLNLFNLNNFFFQKD